MSYSIKEVFKGGGIYTFGQLIEKGSAFFLIPLYTAYLSVDDYGIVGYTQIIINILFAILLISFSGSQTIYYYEKKDKPEEFGSYLFSTNLFLFLISLVYLIFVFFWGAKIYSLFQNNIPYYPYIYISLFIPVIMVFNKMMTSLYLAKKEYKKNSILNIALFFIITICIIIYIVVYDFKAEGFLLGTLLGNIIFFLFTYWYYAKNFKFKFSKTHVLKAVYFGFPLIFHVLSNLLHNMIDRIIIYKYLSLYEVGIYTLSFQIGIGIITIASSFNQSFLPNFFDLLSSDRPKDEIKYEIRKTYSVWLFIFALISLVGILFSKEFIQIIVASNFSTASEYVPFIMLSSFFTCIYYFSSSPLFYYRKTKIISVITFFSLAINIILNLIFIPRYGLYGAVISTIFSHFIFAVIFYFIGKKYFDPNYDMKFTGLLILVLLIGIVLTYLEMSFFNSIIKFAYLCATFMVLSILIRNKFNFDFHQIFRSILKI